MRIFRQVAALEAYRQQLETDGFRPGFVPTMGALHDGHISLVEEAMNSGQPVIVSIFVNPTQFNNPDDLAKYPVTTALDLMKLARAGCHAVFLPHRSEIYPDGYTAPHYDLGSLERVLEGAFRPGHFQGVCQVVDRLLQLAKPATLYMGQKDLQQCLVIGRLLQITNHPVKLVILPTKREPGGLAMSSRNMRLTDQEREQARAIYQVLVRSLKRLKDGEDQALVEADGTGRLQSLGFAVDYVSAREPEQLNDYVPGAPFAILVAASLGPVRLIDNVLSEDSTIF